jgi:hypothetical protein
VPSGTSRNSATENAATLATASTSSGITNVRIGTRLLVNTGISSPPARA